jgi:hypothetical protein
MLKQTRSSCLLLNSQFSDAKTFHAVVRADAGLGEKGCYFFTGFVSLFRYLSAAHLLQPE